MEKQGLLERLQKAFGITDAELGEFEHFYHEKFQEYDNSVYADRRTRLAHLKAFWEGSWWNGRFHFLFSSYRAYDEIVDLGFSIPYLPLFLAERGETARQHFVFVDKNASAKDVSEKILELLGMQGRFIVGDIQDAATFREIGKADATAKRLFVALETVEHLDDAEQFWKALSAFVGDDITVSLPIGPAIPSHHLVFADEAAARTYLEAHLSDATYALMTPPAGTQSAFKILVALGKIR